MNELNHSSANAQVSLSSDLNQYKPQSNLIDGDQHDVIQSLSDVTSDAELMQRARALSKPVQQLPVSTYSHNSVPYYRPPEFTRRLNVFEEVELGATTQFECQCRGHPRPMCTWYLDDAEIPSGDANSRVSIDSTCEETDGTLRLIIRGAQKSDEGAYKCRAENEEGVASTTGYLSILGSSIPPQTPSSSSGVKPISPRSEHAVSAPPLLRAITEQQSLEEREAETYERETYEEELSPLQRFIDNVERGTTCWPYHELDFLRTEDQRAAAAATAAAADAYVTAGLNDDSVDRLRPEESDEMNPDSLTGWESITYQPLTSGSMVQSVGEAMYSPSRVTLMKTSNVSVEELAAAQSTLTQVALRETQHRPDSTAQYMLATSENQSREVPAAVNTICTESGGAVTSAVNTSITQSGMDRSGADVWNESERANNINLVESRVPTNSEITDKNPTLPQNESNQVELSRDTKHLLSEEPTVRSESLKDVLRPPGSVLSGNVGAVSEVKFVGADVDKARYTEEYTTHPSTHTSRPITVPAISHAAVATSISQARASRSEVSEPMESPSDERVAGVIEIDLCSLIDWWSEWLTLPWLIYPSLALAMTVLSSSIELNPALVIVIVAILSAFIFFFVHPVKQNNT